MRWTLLAAALTLLAGCGGGGGSGICDCTADQTCVRGRCFDTTPQSPTFEEPVVTPATCGPVTQVVGPALTAPAPTPDAQGRCALPAAQASGGPGAWVQPLGPHQVGTTLQIAVPAGASGLEIVLQAVSVPVTQLTGKSSAGSFFAFENTAVPLRLQAPDGEVWYDDTLPFPAEGTDRLVHFGSTSPAVGTLTIPNTTRALQAIGAAGLPAGSWSFTVSDYAYECGQVALYAGFCGPQAGITPPPDFAAYGAGVYDVTVTVKPGPRPSPGTLDLGLYLQRCPGGEVGAGGECLVAPLTAAAAPGDRDAQRMLQSLGGLVAGAGVCLGTVTWYDLPDWAQERWAAGLDLDSTACEAQLGQLLAISQPGRSQLNLFLVPDILAAQPDGSRSQVVGIDGTIPGPAFHAGTVQSGAAVSSANLRAGLAACAGGLSLACGADVTAYIAAHEAGHYLGLYHTTEQAGQSFGPVADTPRCDCACEPATTAQQCANGGVAVRGTSCVASSTCGGGRNLMFWLLDSVSQGKISPQQSDVIRSNPLVR